MFDKKTMRGVPTSQQDLEVNEDGYYVYGQNIKRQYDFKVLWDKGYLHEVDSRKPLIAYTSSVGEVGVINESFYRTGDNGAFQGLIQKDITNHTEYGTIYLLTVLKKLFIQFSYNTSMRLILDLELELPVLTTDSTEPYWDYMAYFIYNIQQQYADQLEEKSEYELDLMCQILGVTREEIAQRVAFTQPQYTSKFTVGDLFGVKSIKQVPSGFTPNFVDDGIPYLSQKTGGSYGVNGYLNPEEVDGELELITEGMIVTGVDNVANGVMYWWDEPFYANKMVGITHKDLDKWTAQYIITLLLKQYSGYDYNNKISISVIKDTELELPVIAPNSKQIDWGAIRHAAVGGGGINYLASRQEICNRDLAIIRQLIQ